MKAIAGTGGARPAKNYAHRIPQDLARGIHSQLATGSNDRFTHNSKPSKPSQRETEINFFSDEELFIESADRVEVFSRGEEKRAGAEVERKVQCAESLCENLRPHRNSSPDNNPRAASGATFFKQVDCAADMLFVDPRIRIDKE